MEAAFQNRYGEPPTYVVRAPGRVNLIGEHTDYNDGFVLPMAIDRAAWIALRPSTDDRVTATSLDFDETQAFDLGDVRECVGGSESWVDYLKGTAWALSDAGRPIAGWEGVVVGDVPIGAGLSSSAALEMAVARAFVCLSGSEWNPSEMAILGQRAENRWVGVNCGIMDQMISASGRDGHALLLDCRSMETRHVALPDGVSVVVLDTGTRRGLVDSAYNERRSQCEAAARHFDVEFLRDVSVSVFKNRADELDDLTRRRARHVIGENDRMERAAEAMAAGDAAELGRLMDASHVSLRDDFEVSNEALDTMVALARPVEGCLGARMTGAGFGGCAVALVGSKRAEAFAEEVAAAYSNQTGNPSVPYVCRATNGAEAVGS